MFGDDELGVVPGLQEGMRRYQAWEAAMEEAVLRGGKQLVILELGCGTRVPSVRPSLPS